MKVSLVSVTKPFGEFDDFSTQEYVAAVARVSNPANQMNKDTSENLLKYCIRNKHWSVFEMVDYTFAIQTTRDIGRQILRHRSFSFQEFSQRYSTTDTDNFIAREARLQDTKNRQNSVATDDDLIKSQWEAYQNDVWNHAMNAYTWALNSGIAKECARVVLAEGLTDTKMYMKGSLRSWIHYCQLRMKNGTQAEHMAVATACWNVLCEELPFLTTLQD